MFTFIKRFLAVATLIVAAAAPSVAGATVLAAGAGSGGPAHPVIVVSAPRASAPSSPGFQWGDAGIGAAGVLALAGIGTGAALMVRRRAQHPLAS
ncbi:MAG TPA: hypothetical protein VGH93_07460 [Solirubrobacteraceae bacterium]